MTTTRPAAGLLGTVAAAVVLAAVLAGCSATDAPPEATPTPDRTADVTPSPTPTPTATPQPSPSPSYPDDGALPDTTGDDPAEAIEEIVKFRWHLFEVPNPTKVGLIYAGQCTCYETLRQRVSEFANRGVRLDGAPPAVSRIEVRERGGALATVRYTVTFGSFKVVDGDGGVVEEDPIPDAPDRKEAVLLKDGSRWRVQTIRGVVE